MWNAMDVDARALTGMEMFRVSEMAKMDLRIGTSSDHKHDHNDTRPWQVHNNRFCCEFWGLGWPELQRVICQTLPKMAFGELV